MREYFSFILAFKTANTLRSLRILKVKIGGKLSSQLVRMDRELVKFKQLLRVEVFRSNFKTLHKSQYLKIQIVLSYSKMERSLFSSVNLNSF
jgi:hypothetical protein